MDSMWVVGVLAFVLACSTPRGRTGGDDGDADGEPTPDVEETADPGDPDPDDDPGPEQDVEPEVDPGPCAEDGTACDDGNACTSGDACADGVCVGAQTVVCDEESGPCVTSSCDPETGCVYEAAEDGMECEQSCFSAAVCEAGECVADPETAVECPSPTTACVSSLQCDSGTGECSVEVFDPEGAECEEDGDVCTFEVCDGRGSCAATGELDTCATQQANNPCWTWTCGKQKGCLQTAFLEGASCNDNNGCTANDKCIINPLGQEACVGTPVETDDGNPCTDGSCVGGEVTQKPLDGVGCSPTDGCSDAGVCQAGTCVSTVPCECLEDSDCPQGVDKCLGPVVCDKSGAVNTCGVLPGTEVVCPPSPMACFESTCLPVSGACTLVASPTGVNCDTGDPCITGSTCLGGLCQGGALKSCDDGDPCTNDSCVDGVCQSIDSGDCDCFADEDCPQTADKCDAIVVCEAGACVGAPETVVECEQSGDSCVENVCNPTTGLCDAQPIPDCAPPGSVDLEAVADVWLENTQNKNNFHFLIAGRQCTYPKKRSLIRFDLAGVPPGADVVSATMSLYYEYNHGGFNKIDRNVQVYTVKKPWVETQATFQMATLAIGWGANWLAPGEDYVPEMVDAQLMTPQGSGKYYDFDVTAAVQGWVATPASNHGLLIKANNEEQCGGEIRFISREGAAEKVPKLSVTWE